MSSVICKSSGLVSKIASLNPGIDYLPIYAQACKGAGPLRSGVDVLGLSASTAPVLVLTGVSIAATKAYRPQLWLGWAMYMIGMGALSTLHADANTGKLIGFPVLIGVGVGTLLSGTYFPVLAPLPASENAHALAFFAFCRSFANVSVYFLSRSPRQRTHAYA